MKKTTIGMLLLVCSIAVQAQVGINSFSRPSNNIKAQPNDKLKSLMNANSSNSTLAQSSYWLNYTGSYSSYYGFTSVRNFNYLYNDSLPLVQFGGGTWDHPWIHSLGGVLHPSGEIFMNDPNNTVVGKSMYGYNLTTTTAYTLDSMYVSYIYSRATSNTVVDTLIVKVFTDSPPTNMPVYYFPGMTANFGVDTVWFVGEKYSYASNSPNASNIQTIKIPLTIADTSQYFVGALPVKVGKSVAAGGKIGIGITYKAGSTYALNDTLRNIFNFSSWELSGDDGSGNSYSAYVACSAKTGNPPCDYNESYIIPTDVRYNKSAGWNGFYIPHYAYTKPFVLESHDIFYKVTYGTVGVKENENGKLKVSQNIPNPANNSTSVNYELKENSNVNLTVFDMTGKQVASIVEGAKTAGVHSVVLNTESIQAGIYFYTLTAGENRITRKMTIIK